MEGLKLHIEYLPIYNVSRVYLWDKDHYYKCENGKIVANKLIEAEPAPQDSFFFEGPDYFIQGIANALMEKHNIKESIINTGRTERFKDETTWLRSLIEKQLK